MSTGSIIQSLPASQVDRLLAPAHTRWHHRRTDFAHGAPRSTAASITVDLGRDPAGSADAVGALRETCGVSQADWTVRGHQQAAGKWLLPKTVARGEVARTIKK
jgi:hypothetical protein